MVFWGNGKGRFPEWIPETGCLASRDSFKISPLVRSLYSHESGLEQGDCFICGLRIAAGCFISFNVTGRVLPFIIFSYFCTCNRNIT